MQRTKTIWMNAEEDGYLECVNHNSREQADRHADLLHEENPSRVRAACLKLVVSWEDGHGLNETPIHIEGSVEDE